MDALLSREGQEKDANNDFRNVKEHLASYNSIFQLRKIMLHNIQIANEYVKEVDIQRLEKPMHSPSLNVQNKVKHQLKQSIRCRNPVTKGWLGKRGHFSKMKFS